MNCAESDESSTSMASENLARQSADGMPHRTIQRTSSEQCPARAQARQAAQTARDKGRACRWITAARLSARTLIPDGFLFQHSEALGNGGFLSRTESLFHQHLCTDHYNTNSHLKISGKTLADGILAGITRAFPHRLSWPASTKWPRWSSNTKSKTAVQLAAPSSTK